MHKRLFNLELNKIIEYLLKQSICRDCREIGNFCGKQLEMIKKLRLVSKQFKRLTDKKWYEIMWQFYIDEPQVLYRFGYTNATIDKYIINAAITKFNTATFECILSYKPEILNEILNVVKFIFDLIKTKIINSDLLCDSIVELSISTLINDRTYIKFISKFLERGNNENLIELINVLLSGGYDKAMLLLNRYCGYVNTINGIEFYTPHTIPKDKELFPGFEDAIDDENQKLFKMQKLWNTKVPFIPLSNIDIKSLFKTAVNGFMTYQISEFIIALIEQNFISKDTGLQIFYKCCETCVPHELSIYATKNEYFRGMEIAAKNNNFAAFEELYDYIQFDRYCDIKLNLDKHINLINLSMKHDANKIFIFLIFKHRIKTIDAAKKIIIPQIKYAKIFCHLFVKHRLSFLIPHLIAAAEQVKVFIKKRYWFAF